MKTTLTHRLLAGSALDEADLQALKAAADGFKQAAQAGMERPLLKGKHIALLSDGALSADAREFARAAALLGARVSELDVRALLNAGHASDSLRVLPRLYDMVWCDRLTAEQTSALQANIAVPLCHGIASLPPAATDDGDRLYLAQAVLVDTLAEV